MPILAHLENKKGQKETLIYISNVLNTFLNRDYNFDGSNGGLFKVEKPRADMRKTDLWMQLNWWLVEKYGYENE